MKFGILNSIYEIWNLELNNAVSHTGVHRRKHCIPYLQSCCNGDRENYLDSLRRVVLLAVYRFIARCYVVAKVYEVFIYVIQSLLGGFILKG